MAGRDAQDHASGVDVADSAIDAITRSTGASSSASRRDAGFETGVAVLVGSASLSLS
jgi:hypothetical protein